MVRAVNAALDPNYHIPYFRPPRTRPHAAPQTIRAALEHINHGVKMQLEAGLGICRMPSHTARCPYRPSFTDPAQFLMNIDHHHLLLEICSVEFPPAAPKLREMTLVEYYLRLLNTYATIRWLGTGDRRRRNNMKLAQGYYRWYRIYVLREDLESQIWVGSLQ